MKRPSSTQALFAAARNEQPGASTRDAMWKNLEVNLAIVPAAAASGIRVADGAHGSTPPPPPSTPLSAPASPAATSSAASAATSPSTALKAGLIGGGVGSGITAVTVLLALHAAPSLAPSPVTQVDRNRDTPQDERAPSMLVPIAPPAAERGAEHPTAHVGGGADEGDVLSREVALVMGARQALLAGNAEHALDLASRARALHGQLDKEALTLEVRALRALGRDAEADRTEMELRVTYPR